MAPLVKYTDNLILRVLDESAASSVCDFYKRNVANFEKFEPTRPDGFYSDYYQSLQLHRERIAFQSGNFLRYFLFEKNNDSQVIGAVNFNIKMDAGVYEAEVGYKVDRDYLCRGYAYEACEAGICVMLEHYGIHKYTARIHRENIASLILASKLGFVFQDVEYQAANILGKYEDLERHLLVI